MTSSTLLEYLAEPNPDIDNRRSLPGLPTKVDFDELIQVTEWSDFTYATLMDCYGRVLSAERGRFPDVSPPLTTLEREIFDEDSLDHLLSRSVRPRVSESLRIAWEDCYPKHPGIDMTRGGRARGLADNPSGVASAPERGGPSAQGTGEVKTYPDWAGVQVNIRSGAYINRCPGDTKLSTKWQSTGDNTKEHYFWPLAQIINYSGKTWNTRYGYLITQKELVALRISRAIIGSGIARTRTSRTAVQTPTATGEYEGNYSPLFVPPSSPPLARQSTTPERQSHRSNVSIGSPLSPSARYSASRSPEQQLRHQRRVSVTSACSAMSVDCVSGRSRQGSITESMGGLSVTDEEPVTSSEHHPSSDSFQPSERGGEYRPIEMKSISWDNSGPGKLTVGLALWWIHMMAAAPGCDKTVGPLYPALDTWVLKDGVYRHTTTGFAVKVLPKGATLISSREGTPRVPATPPQQSTSLLSSSSPLSSPPPDMEDIAQMVRRNDGQWQYQTVLGSAGVLPETTPVWSTARGEYYYAQAERGSVRWVQADAGRRIGGSRASDSGSGMDSDESMAQSPVAGKYRRR